MNAIKFSNKYILRNKKLIIVYVFLCIVLSGIGMLSPMVSARILDSIVEKSKLKIVINMCLLLFFIGIINLILAYIKNLLFIKISSYSTNSLNIDIIKHIHKSPISYISNVNSAYLNHRINSDSNEVINFTLSLYSDFIQSLLILISSSIILFIINYEVFVISVILVTFNLIMYNSLKKKLYSFNNKLKEKQNKFFSDLNDQLYYMKFIKVNSISEWFIKKLNGSFSSYFNVRINYEKFSCIFDNINGIVIMIAQLVLFIFGANEVIKGSISVGIFTIIITYFNSLKGSISYFFSLGKSYQTNNVSYKRIKELLELPCENCTGELINRIDKIIINNLNFKYEKNQVFKNFNFKFYPGVVYGIFGKNGSGKSTFIDILVGLHNNFEGKIFINDKSIKDINIYKVRESCFGVCEQEPMLINDTIYNNISLGMPIDESKLNLLIKLLNLSNFIDECENKLDSVINPYSTNLSGGEKQKISILRTLLKNDSSVLIFDEPTSALDYKSKINLLNYLKEIKEDKIIILISHDDEIKEIVDEVILL